MKRLQLLLLGLAMVIAGDTISQEFVLGGEYRPRLEYTHGLRDLVGPDDDFGLHITQRTRLNMQYNQNALTSKLSLQDVRTWGNQSQLVGNEANAFSVHEAWFQVGLGQSKIVAIKAGRQEIIYDDHRMFGNVGWAQQARSHDALLLKFKTGTNSKLDVGIAYNQDAPKATSTIYLTPGSYKSMHYAWFHSDFNGGLGLSLLAMNKGDQVNNGNEYEDRFSQTFGTHLTYKKSKIGIALNAFYQTGKAPSFNEKDLAAHLLGFDFKYGISEKATLFLGYERQSGNSQVDPDEKQNAFSPYFGTNHKFNGHMDYFYVGNHSNSVGLQDIYGKIKFGFSKAKLGIDVHMFSSAADVADPNDPTKALSAYLGTEIDVYTSFKVGSGVSAQIGYSQMLPSESMVVLKGGSKDEIQNWLYAMLTVKPTFFKYKKENK